MSAVQVYKLVCDGDGCTSVVLTPHERAGVARGQIADQRGWTSRTIPGTRNGRSLARTVDLCAECSTT